MFKTLPWSAHKSLGHAARPQTAVLALSLLASASGAYLLFLHLMQTSAPFAESVAKVSPWLADTFSCGCPFCSGQACLPPADQMGLARFHGKLPF